MKEVGIQDRTLSCADCGAEFTFTVAEQEFFRERGFDHDPKRCQACRRARRQKRGRPPRTPRPAQPDRGVRIRHPAWTSRVNIDHR